jgi:hypothetical protein
MAPDQTLTESGNYCIASPARPRRLLLVPHHPHATMPPRARTVRQRQQAWAGVKWMTMLVASFASASLACFFLAFCIGSAGRCRCRWWPSPVRSVSVFLCGLACSPDTASPVFCLLPDRPAAGRQAKPFWKPSFVPARCRRLVHFPFLSCSKAVNTRMLGLVDLTFDLY